MPANQFDVFISYARKDNATGWVTAIRDFLVKDARTGSRRVPEVFLDTSEIHTMQDWKTRILSALQSSRVLLICLSPNYLASPYCTWEREEFAQREVRMRARIGAGHDDDGVTAQVFFVDLPETDPALSQEWRERFERTHGIDIRPWFTEGPAALSRGEVVDHLQRLGTDVFHRLELAERSEAAVGNVQRFNPFFVGRVEELTRLHETVSRPGSIGVVTAVHGLGGLGKTELTVHYAHAFRDAYPGGVWLLAAEGQRDLVALVGTLAREPRFGFSGSEEARLDPVLLGREVLAELERRIAAQGPALLLFDNVSEASLLAAPQVQQLPANRGLHLVATTRLGVSDFQGRAEVGFLQLGGLSDAAALTLISDVLVAGEAGALPFANAAEEDAAREIVRLLGGFTLGVEQVAVFLRARRDEVSPSLLLVMLRRRGLAGLESEATIGEFDALRHQQRLASIVFATTLDQLTEPVPEDADPTGARRRRAGLIGEAARTALAAASLLPPDSVPWPWLHSVVSRLVPEAVAARDLAPQGDWPQVTRVLAARQLLTPGDYPELARMHRLLGDHVRPTPDSPVADAVRAVLLDQARQGSELGGLPGWAWLPWVRGLGLARQSDPSPPRFVQQLLGAGADALLEAAGNGARAEVLALVEACETDLAASPASVDPRTRTVLLQVVGRLWQDVDRAQALTAYQDSLAIARRIADALPGITPQWDLCVSLANVGSLSGEPALLAEAASIAEHLHRQHPEHAGLRGLAVRRLRALADAIEQAEPERAADLRARADDIAQEGPR